MSDFHLGFPSRGEAAVERAIDWTAAREPDLVLITGDLLSRPGAEGRLRELLTRVPGSFTVLGNHDFAHSRDPFSKPSAVSGLPSTTVLFDDARTVERRGLRVQIVGVDPRTYRLGSSRPSELADPDVDLRILLCYFPSVIDRVQPGTFDLVLALGISTRVRSSSRTVAARCGSRTCAGLTRRGSTGRPGGVLHVSPGLGDDVRPVPLLRSPGGDRARAPKRRSGVCS